MLQALQFRDFASSGVELAGAALRLRVECQTLHGPGTLWGCRSTCDLCPGGLSSPLHSRHSPFKTEPAFVWMTQVTLRVSVFREAFCRTENENALIKERGQLDQGAELAEWLRAPGAWMTRTWAGVWALLPSSWAPCRVPWTAPSWRLGLLREWR